MNRSTVVLLLCASLAGARDVSAQANDDARFQNSIVGWWSDRQYDNLIKPSTDAVYLKQVAIDDAIVGWMQKSYEPVGGLGTYRRQKTKLYYGAYFMTWDVSYEPAWLDAKGNFRRDLANRRCSATCSPTSSATSRTGPIHSRSMSTSASVTSRLPSTS